MLKLELNTMRPCLIGKSEKKAFFHGWWYAGDELCAILEFESGHVKLMPQRRLHMKFIDNKFADYDWHDLKGENQDE